MLGWALTHTVACAMLSQIIKVIKLLGLPRALRMKKRHDLGLRYIRGYVACCCWRTLLNNGFLDQVNRRRSLDPDSFARDSSLQPDVLEAIVEYLDGIGLLQMNSGLVRLTRAGHDLLAEPRGLFELLWAYEPCFSQLHDLLTGTKKYGRDLTRDVTYVGIGSGRLCEQLPYPVMRRMVLEHKCKMVLDLGCGDLALLSGLCRQDQNIHCHGIDYDEDMIRYNRNKLTENDFNGRLTTQQGDMFNLPQIPKNLPPVDCITACDTFHEYLGQQDKLIALFQNLRKHFPQAIFVVGEFCLQNPAWLRKHPTATLEHHLFHQLSNQQIGTAAQWRQLFQEAGLEIIEQQVYDLIGHGYFALR